MKHQQAKSVLSAALVALAAVALGCNSVTSTEPNADLRVVVNPPQIDVSVGASVPLQAVVRDAAGNPAAQQVFWTSSDSAVAAVSDKGIVTGRAIGVAHVFASVPGSDADVTVRVVPPTVTSVAVTPASASIAVGATQPLSATVKDASGAVRGDRTVFWSSDNEAVAGVSAFTGVVTARAPGAVKITASVDGMSGSATLSITAQPVAPPAVPPPAVGFVFACTNLVCAFQETAVISDAVGEVWAWDFGDGQTSPHRHPDNRYAAPGTYKVSVTITDSKGRKSSAQRTAVVTTVPPGTRSGVRLVNRATGRCLSVEGGSSDRGPQLVTRSCDGGPDQLYTLPSGDGVGPIQLNAFIERYVELIAIDYVVRLWSWNGSQYQRWTYTPSGQVRNYDTNWCLSAGANAAPVAPGACTGDANQHWDVRQ